MRLRTHHGTYVVAGQNGELLHFPIPLDEDHQSVLNGVRSIDLETGLIEIAITEGPLAPSTMVFLAESVVVVRRGGMYLCADPTLTELRFDRNHAGPWEWFTIESLDGTAVRHGSAEQIAYPPSPSRPILVEGLAGYQIMHEAADTKLVHVTWPELSNKPISRYSLPDGSWIVDVDITSDISQPFLIYWFYPFDAKIHVWRLDRTGQRILGYDLPDTAARAFLLGRRALGPAVVSRLHMLSQKCGEWGALALLSGELCAAAKAGSADALYAVLCCPTVFPPATVRSLAARAFHMLRASNRARTDEADIHLKRVTAAALAGVLTRLDSALGGLSDHQLQTELDLCHILADPTHLPAVGRTLHFTLHCHTQDSLVSLLGASASIQTLGILLRPQAGTVEFHYINSGGGIRLRILDSVRYVLYSFSINQAEVWDGLAALNPAAKIWMIRFEVGDLPTTSEPSVAFERLVGDTKFALVPDSYYFGFKGFRRDWFRGNIPPWNKKANRVLWRGSTTGAYDLTRETVANAPRVRLCELGRTIGPVVDFGITDVVHTRSDADAEDIKLFLQDHNIIRERMPQHVMGAAKFLVEIDGNANSWGFFAKLLMGCCVLKVDSPFEQWFYAELQPWVHYVPIARDLSDLHDKITWCLTHERKCRKIADEGCRLAESLDFEQEMATAAKTFVSMAWAAE